jgi:hypothetical protein
MDRRDVVDRRMPAEGGPDFRDRFAFVLDLLHRTLDRDVFDDRRHDLEADSQQAHHNQSNEDKADDAESALPIRSSSIFHFSFLFNDLAG